MEPGLDEALSRAGADSRRTLQGSVQAGLLWLKAMVPSSARQCKRIAQPVGVKCLRSLSEVNSA